LDTDRASVSDKLIAAVHREHHDCRARGQKGDLPSRLKPIHDRHLQIHKHYIGMQRFDFFDGGLSIVRLTAHDPPLVLRDP
jgi:hypothetical protein